MDCGGALLLRFFINQARDSAALSSRPSPQAMRQVGKRFLDNRFFIGNRQPGPCLQHFAHTPMRQCFARLHFKTQLGASAFTLALIVIVSLDPNFGMQQRSISTTVFS
jgi:hypothetical protein